MEAEDILKDYELDLEDLTFNSKPIINTLTMKAEKHKELAPRLVELIQTRFFKVRQECKIPTLYLMDSMIKNLGGEFVKCITKNIVGVFCHAFETMNDPKTRISLYKLRQTWPNYIPVRKLAAIDKHIHAIDPNWPITAQEPSSPTIFVNPKFLGSESSAQSSTAPRKTPPKGTKSGKASNSNTSKQSSVNSSNTDSQEQRAERNESPKKKSQTPPSVSSDGSNSLAPPTNRKRSNSPQTLKNEKRHSQTPPPSVATATKGTAPSKGNKTDQAEHGRSRSRSPLLNVMDKRRKVLEEQRQKKIDKQRSMGLIPSQESGDSSSSGSKRSYDERDHPNLDFVSHKTTQPPHLYNKNESHRHRHPHYHNDHPPPLHDPPPHPPPPLHHDRDPYDFHQHHHAVSLLPNPPTHANDHGPPTHRYPPADEDFPPNQRGRGYGRHQHIPPPRGNESFRPRGGGPPPPKHYRTSNRDRPYPSTRPHPMYRGRSPPNRGAPPPYPVETRPPETRPPPSLDATSVLDLYRQLETSGLFTTDVKPPAPPSQPLPFVPEIRLNIKDLKRSYNGLIDLLHRGEPCTSCGLRFTDDQRDAYQQHLDWHFNENRMDREGNGVTMRNWFIHPDDWLTLDASELPRQNEPLLTLETDSREGSLTRDEDKPSGISCKVLPAEDNEVCNICHEQLEQFWQEEEEEWHYKDALRTPDDLLYHSYCYVDSKADMAS